MQRNKPFHRHFCEANRASKETHKDYKKTKNALSPEKYMQQIYPTLKPNQINLHKQWLLTKFIENPSVISQDTYMHTYSVKSKHSRKSKVKRGGVTSSKGRSC